MTTAIRDLVEAAIGQGADIRQVVRFKPLLGKSGWSRPRASQAGPVQVLDVPRMGTRHWFSTRLTRMALARAGRVPEPDVVVSHTAASFAVARRVFAAPATRHAFVLHACDLDHRDLRFALSRADAVYCRSQALRRQLATRHGFEARGVLSSGIPAGDFGSPDRDLADPTLRLLVAATLIPLRNIAKVIQATKLLQDKLEFRLDIYGDGPLYPQLDRLVERLQLRPQVTLHGFRERATVLAAMARAHMFLMPSVNETLGLAYLEAMAHGCVVLGHRGWGIDGIVEDGRDGYLVKSADPEAIAAKILDYVGSDRAAMHRRALETARAHTAEAAAAAYAAMIRTTASMPE